MNTMQNNTFIGEDRGGATLRISFHLASLMVHLYLCLPDRCVQKIHKSKKGRRFHFVQFYTVCLLYSYVFSVRTGQAERSINASLGPLGNQNVSSRQIGLLLSVSLMLWQDAVVKTGLATPVVGDVPLSCGVVVSKVTTWAALQPRRRRRSGLQTAFTADYVLGISI